MQSKKLAKLTIIGKTKNHPKKTQSLHVTRPKRRLLGVKTPNSCFERFNCFIELYTRNDLACNVEQVYLPRFNLFTLHLLRFV